MSGGTIVCAACGCDLHGDRCPEGCQVCHGCGSDRCIGQCQAGQAPAPIAAPAPVEVYVLTIDGLDYQRWTEVHASEDTARQSFVEWINDRRDDDEPEIADYDEAMDYANLNGIGYELDGPLVVRTAPIAREGAR
jgi:hypothetical protein